MNVVTLHFTTSLFQPSWKEIGKLTFMKRFLAGAAMGTYLGSVPVYTIRLIWTLLGFYKDDRSW